MNNTVYVIGAGINQVIKNYNGLSPPLINNFFIVGSKLKIGPTQENDSQAKELYDYIQRYWKKSKTNLASVSFDIEECFTFVESQLKESLRNNNRNAYARLAKIRFQLRVFVARVLSTFHTEAIDSEEMYSFGKLLWEQKPMIITFNYDTFIEDAISTASGMLEVNGIPGNVRFPEKDHDLSDEDLSCRFHNWDYNLGYGVKFDEVELDLPGVPIPVSGERFYANPKNQLYTWHILKLHGSLNWFQYLPVSIYPEFIKNESDRAEKPREGTILKRTPFWLDKMTLPMRGQWFIDPIIVPPTLFKEQYLGDVAYSKLLLPVWEKVKEALSKCKRLIVIGYSFPPTDFATKKLFIEAFAENQLEQLTIVNPDTSTVQRVKELCHFEGPVIVCKDLREFGALEIRQKTD